MLELFRSVASYELRGKEPQREAVFSVDWQAFQTALLTKDPAFNWPWWEPWEVRRLMRELVAIHNDDPGVQRECVQRARRNHGG